ncbi:MAG: hypothetical protein AAGI08_13395 [Bacteroidota bacterium]
MDAGQILFLLIAFVIWFLGKRNEAKQKQKRRQQQQAQQEQMLGQGTAELPPQVEEKSPFQQALEEIREALDEAREEAERETRERENIEAERVRMRRRSPEIERLPPPALPRPTPPVTAPTPLPRPTPIPTVDTLPARRGSREDRFERQGEIFRSLETEGHDSIFGVHDDPFKGPVLGSASKPTPPPITVKDLGLDGSDPKALQRAFVLQTVLGRPGGRNRSA